MNWRQLPNTLTALRIGLTPFLYGSIAAGYPRHALVLLAAAAVSDALDGFLARRFGWETRLGGLLDPIADKLLLNASFVGLWVVDAIPAWMMLLVFGRDLLIVLGALAYHSLIGPLHATPTALGKLNTAAQITFVVLVLTQLGFGLLPSHWLDSAIWTVALVTVASGLDYVVRWSLKAGNRE
jgi:cardiolipin synthase (CMP-forming)